MESRSPPSEAWLKMTARRQFHVQSSRATTGQESEHRCVMCAVQARGSHQRGKAIRKLPCRPSNLGAACGGSLGPAALLGEPHRSEAVREGSLGAQRFL